jgi:hypothetical protein
MAAATRRGKTLATYASDWEPNGRRWDATVKDKHLHPTIRVPAIRAGKLGTQYLRIVRRQIAAFAATQPKQVRLAAKRLAAGMRRGATVWMVTNAHLHTFGSAVPGQLKHILMFGRGYAWPYFAGRIPRGDILLHFGYLRYPHRPVREALRRGCEAVVICVDAGETNDRLTHIRSCFEDFDTVVELPNYPIRVLPSSGAVQTPQWYALMAETLAASKPPAGAGGDPP